MTGNSFIPAQRKPGEQALQPFSKFRRSGDLVSGETKYRFPLCLLFLRGVCVDVVKYKETCECEGLISSDSAMCASGKADGASR